MEIFDFPSLPVSKQLFHVPGAAIEGGYTSGAVRMISPEPGGRAVLELQPSFQVGEWDYPFMSWLMSKGNGEIFKIRLAPTPQVLSSQNDGTPWEQGVLWSNHQPWAGDISASFAQAALEGSNVIVLNMSGYGDIAKPGHVVGHRHNCYMIDKVTFNETAQTATIVVKPPLRANVEANDTAYFRPFFTGTIGNIGEVRATYDAENVGNIQPGKIIFAEAIV
jgi:hypothetical protein